EHSPEELSEWCEDVARQSLRVGLAEVGSLRDALRVALHADPSPSLLQESPLAQSLLVFWAQQKPGTP
ncbi:MAG: hypothetical protein KC416_04310, partial [Myxococcales bacterium]|nr:hypothetical protein [Myxococcales bacterium]